ncbi:hypothetical protein GQ53DRAFT_783139 [Thozetella sp. PMI_491]|nr:hypothetical protein GQ53DRAFT_783139 [Thozetella sp. PMI_491]
MVRTETQPRALFIYGTLCAKPLLAWVLTGDASNVSLVSSLASPACVIGFARQDNACAIVQGFVLQLETAAQRKKLDHFEGELYNPVPVIAYLTDDNGKPQEQTIDADMYLWDGDMEILSSELWNLEDFFTKRLEDWLDLFEGMEMMGN